MVRPRIGLPLESTAGTTPESDAHRLLEAWLDTLARAAGEFVRQLEPVALGCAVLLAGCGPAPTVEVEGIVVDGRTGAPIAGALVSDDGGGVAETDEDGRFAIAMEEGPERRLRVEGEGRCLTTEAVDVRRTGMDVVTLRLFEHLEVPQDLVQVGFHALATVEFRLRCAPDTPIEWTQVGGPALPERSVQTEDRGRVLRIRTHALEELVRLDDRPGVIAFDGRQRGAYRFRLRAAFDGVVTEREVGIAAAPLSSGLFEVAIGVDIYLNGGSGDSHHWVLVSRPEGSAAELSDTSTRTPIIRPDADGTYVVEHVSTGTQMVLQAASHGREPLDCGNATCHGAEDEGWRLSAHARTLAHGFADTPLATVNESCSTCHATRFDIGASNSPVLHGVAGAGMRDATLRETGPGESVSCAACHGPSHVAAQTAAWQTGAMFATSVCARCHAGDERAADHPLPHVQEWRHSPMSRFTRGLRSDDPALRAGCAGCHSSQGFVSWHTTGVATPAERMAVAPITCATCHESHGASRPLGLRVYDTSDPVAGRPTEDLGAGALCASCHRPGVARDGELDHAPHAAQAGLLIGRGARTSPDIDAGAHMRIADTCTRCHMTRPDPADASFGHVGGHTFSVRARSGEPALSDAACSPCHGETAPAGIGVGDWNRDGTEGPIAQEHDDALTIVTELLRARIAALQVSDGCTPARRATDVIDLDATLHLVDTEGAVLGDCDGDARFAEGESAVTVRALPDALRDAAYDVALLRSDGSHGVHNPRYTFSILGALTSQLE